MGTRVKWISQKLFASEMFEEIAKIFFRRLIANMTLEEAAWETRGRFHKVLVVFVCLVLLV